MNTGKKNVYLLVALLALVAGTYCKLFQPSPVETSEPEGEAQSLTLTPSPTPTLAPTNLVKLVDDGSPLPPRIVDVIPSGGQEIGAKGSIRIQFDQPMDQNATSRAWGLTSPDGTAVDGEITWPQADTLLFQPAQPLTPGEVYRATLSTEAASAAHVGLLQPLTFDVVVAKDLLVSQVFPAPDTVDVESDAVITVIFNRPVVALMTVEDQGTLPHPLQITPPLTGRGEWLNTSVYVFRPDEPLLSATQYTVRVEAGLTDVLGAQLADSYQWQFTTIAPGIASFGLRAPLRVNNPEDNYENVFLDASFEIRFLQPMIPSSVGEAFQLYSFQGETVPVQMEWESDDYVVITPTRRLSLGTDYTMLLSPTARAATGGTLAEGLRWNFRTLMPPGVATTYPANGETQAHFSNRLSIEFRSPINPETVQGRIYINPLPDKEISWFYNAWSWSIEFYGLDPSTEYRVDIEPGIEDIYGNPITQPYQFRFRTAAYNPSAYLDLPYAPAIYRLGGPMKYYLSYVNVDSVTVKLYRLPGTVFSQLSSGQINRWDYQPPDDYWANTWVWKNKGRLNQIVHESASLQNADGEELAPGFYFVTLESPQIYAYGPYLDSRLIVVANANLTFKTTPTEGLVWLTDLDQGKPIKDVTAYFYDSRFAMIGQGATDANGLLYLELPPPENLYEGRFAMVNDGEHFAFAYSDCGSGVSPYEFGIWSNYYTLPGQPVAYVYTDRPLYRPGQTVYFKGVLRQNDDLDYSLLPWEKVEVQIQSYNETIYKETLSLSEFGTFDGQITLDENAALGYYSIQVISPETGSNIGGVGFSVAEYRKPEFRVTTTTLSDDVLAGTEFTVDIAAEYYSGGGVANAEVEWALSAVKYSFQPGGELGRFTFEDYDRDTNFYGDFYGTTHAEVIASGKGQTDENGQLQVTLPADLSETRNSRQLTFEATVTDIAGTSVSDRVTVIVHQAAVYPGVRAARYVGLAGEEQSFDIVVVDWDGEPEPGAQVDVEIVERRWYSVQKQDTQGYITWESTVEEIPVATYTGVTMDSRGRASVTFVPENGGVFKAKVTARDVYGNQARAGAYLWVSSSSYVTWRQTDNRRMELVADQESYVPGDVAEILIASPFPGDNYALVTLERGHIRDQQVIRLTSNSTIYRLPITAEMAPNIYLSVIVVQGAGAGGKPDFRMGMIELKVDTRQQAIQVEIQADREQAGPGDRVTYFIRTTDHAGQPVSAEVSVALVDLATLSLSAPNSQPILDYFYDQRSLSVRTAVPIVMSIEHYLPALEDRISQGEGMGSGGGKGSGDFGVFSIREEFEDTAFWQARIRTDQNGKASLTVTLPDNLTIWRMDARAVTPETLVGDGENDLRSTKPLLVRPQTPRFFVVEDQARIGAAVHNNTQEDLSIVVSLQAEGLVVKSAPSQRLTLPAGSQTFVTWDVEVLPDVERVDLVFAAAGGGYSDASRPTLGGLDDQGIPVYKYEAPETVGTAGMMDEGGSRTEGISIPSTWDITRGDLTVKISPSLVAGMAEGLDYLKHYPYECVEQTISRFLPNVLTTQALKTADISDPALENQLKEQVNVALQRLYNWQRPDGGWGWWAESPVSDPLTSAYVVLGLVEAQAAGYHVNADTLHRGLNFLQGRIQSLESLDQQYLLNRQAFLLYVLARAGLPEVGTTVQMFDLRQSLSLYSRAYLAETLWLIDPQDPRLDTLISDFVNAAVLSATGVYWQEDWRDYRNWNTDTRTTAIVLATLIQIDPQNQLNANAVRWLMSHRTAGRWGTTQETAWSLMTLTRWMVTTGELEAGYDWAVGLNGERLGDGSADASTLKQTRVLQADVSQLFLDQVNRLTIARDPGPGNLYYTAHLNVYLPVEQIQPLERGIIISREYFNPQANDDLTPVNAAEQGDLLLARLTIVVPKDLHYVVIDDPLPAGLEAVDQSLETSPEFTAPKRYDFETLWRGGWGWWYFDHIELRDERLVLSADYLPAGTYVYTYIVRASFPGKFHLMPPTAQEFYFPEVYGRGAGSLFTVQP